MNERFLSKAKRVDNGEWITGWFLRRKVNVWKEDEEGSPTIPNGRRMADMIHEKDGVDVGVRALYEIDPSTLCACTGLKDKNGVLIYEWDKVMYEGALHKGCIESVVKWYDSDCCFGIEVNKIGDYDLFSTRKIKLEVIGNIRN